LFDKIILHVGLHKTGTTSLQNYFGSNREILKSLGILYPALSINHFTPNNHSWPLKNLTMIAPEHYHLNITNNILNEELSAVVESLNTQFSMLGESKESTLLLSGEGVSTLKADELTTLKEKLLSISTKDVGIEVHYFTRNTADYISSVIQQRLKGGTREDIILTGLANISPFKSFLNHRLYNKVFTGALIKEHSYEKACAYIGGLEAYFSENILNIEQSTLPYIPQRENSSLSHISFQLIRYYLQHSNKYARVPIEGSRYKKNIKTLSQISGDKFMISDEQKYKLMALIEKPAHRKDWTLFFKDKNLPLENMCWDNFDVVEVKRHLNLVDIECQQVLIDFFNYKLNATGENTNIASLVTYLANLNKPKSRFMILRRRAIRVLKKII